MPKFLALTAALVFASFSPLMSRPALSAEPLVVVELFTSQGCSHCPPADALIAELAEWPDVLPLSLHVDYWDFIGWQDMFALKENTARQALYAPRTDRRRLFTPLLVVGGVDMVEGYTPMKVVDRIGAHRALSTGVTVQVTPQADGFAVRAISESPLPAAAAIVVVLFSPSEDVAIERGENAGRAARYTNVVTGWRNLGTWDGRAPLEWVQEAPEQAGAILIQSADQGMVLAAARLR